MDNNRRYKKNNYIVTILIETDKDVDDFSEFFESWDIVCRDVDANGNETMDFEAVEHTVGFGKTKVNVPDDSCMEAILDENLKKHAMDLLSLVEIHAK